MKIVDLTKEHKQLYFWCLEDWSDEMKQSGSHKANWFEKMKDKGLGVKLALDDEGEVGGMIQYLPIEHTFIEGKELYFITCTWVHGYDKGRGCHAGAPLLLRGRGIEKARKYCQAKAFTADCNQCQVPWRGGEVGIRNSKAIYKK